MDNKEKKLKIIKKMDKVGMKYPVSQKEVLDPDCDYLVYRIKFYKEQEIELVFSLNENRYYYENFNVTRFFYKETISDKFDSRLHKRILEDLLYLSKHWRIK